MAPDWIQTLSYTSLPNCVGDCYDPIRSGVYQPITPQPGQALLEVMVQVVVSHGEQGGPHRHCRR